LKLDQTLFDLPVGVVTVNRRYAIQQINVAARRLLGSYHAALGDDFLHQAQHVQVTQLRDALDAAFRGAPTQLDDLPLSDAQQDGERCLRVQCCPACEPTRRC
jgi:nitrogen fixation/metabolism regulation signal transduction histidine kinase